MECFQSALEIAAAVLTPLLAVTVILTSIRQYRLSSQGLSLSRERLDFDLRLALFDKRLGVFHGMQRFIGAVCQNPDLISEQNLYGYLSETSLGDYIFDERRKDILLKVYNKANKLLFVNRRTERLKMQGPKKVEEYQSSVEEEYELSTWFSEQLGQNKEDFRDYFEFKLEFE